MSALEIVLISVTGTFVILAILAVIVVQMFNKAMNNKIIDYKVLNDFAPESPIVFLGDSLTDFYPVHEFIHDERIVNRGIANETTYDIMGRIDDIISLKPHTVILLAGINDYLRKGVKSPLTVSQNVIKIVEKLKETVSDVRLVSLYPVNKKKLKISWLYLRKVNNKKIILTNEYLKKYCRKNNIEFIDMYPKLTDETLNLNKDYTIEGLHLNLNGYDAITPVYKQIIDGIK